ncbi:unnamed protein product [Aphanomyces euteiches]|uniref:NEDD8-activating enzyme E1 regulatory subunit n=1 Tax=Aphanomyces euteiches TaxID=100861 RepID=A0A6G0WBY6_9STRA|nr:hypothetical protein Ae201684_016842 [Aphanomyces euteiches]
MATTDKYDRQLRLWGAAGQQKLMATKLLLLNAGPTGSEVLKNLVLPGVGSFEICDDQTVCQADLGNNFFVKSDDLNRPRAQVVTEWMLEMNSDVQGTYRVASPSEVLEIDIDYVKRFNMVIATQMTEPSLSKLASYCHGNAIPLLILHSYGLIGYFRLQVPDHSIVDSKPDAPWHDLRISQPFPELQKFADSFDLASLDSHAHGHVPYVVILIQSINEWKAAHGGQLPTGFALKEEFKALVQSKSRGSFGHELNFTEAIDNAFKAYTLPKDIIPDEVHDVLNHARMIKLTQSTSSFWFLARALADYVEKHACLPLSGHVPDMTAFTNDYVSLQKLYVEKASRDCDEVFALVRGLLENAGSPATSIARDEVAEFCKFASSIRMLQTRSLQDEVASVNLTEVDIEEENEKQSPLIWYFLIRAVQEYINEFGKYPGIDGEEEKDIKWLVEKARNVVEKAQANEPFPPEWITNDHAREVSRYFEAEIHNIAAILGGIGSQEAVKIITHQFMPMNNTYIFNGITGCAATYNL